MTLSGEAIIGEQLLPNNLQQQIRDNMSINLYLSAAHSTLSNPPSKVSSSQGTDASEPLVFGKHLSLISCASSLSIEENQHQSSDNELFARYLFAADEKSKESCFGKLKDHYDEILQRSPQQLQSFLRLGQQSQDERGRVMEHFIGSWLLFMGYGSSQNKKYFINRIRLTAGDSKAHKFAKIYSNLGLLKLNADDLQKLMLDTCRNGWEYLIRQLLKMEPSCLVRVPL